MKHISISAFKEVIESEANNSTVDFINVCTPAEYKEKHIIGIRNVPLDTLPSHIAELQDKKTIYVHCRSGNRSKKAIETLTALGVRAELVNVAGGLLAWSDAGFRTGTHATGGLPIMRQVFIVAGTLILLSTLLSLLTHPSWIFLGTFVGGGLLLGGLSGWCGMYLLLSKIPWNK